MEECACFIVAVNWGVDRGILGSLPVWQASQQRGDMAEFSDDQIAWCLLIIRWSFFC